MKLWMWMTILVAAVPLGALASEELIGISSEYWVVQRTEDNDEDCVPLQTGSSTCLLFPAGDDKDPTTSFNPLRRVISVTTGGAGRCCFVSDPAFTISGTEVADGSTGPGSCPFTFEAAGGRYDSRPNRLHLIAAGTNGIDSGICSVAVTTANGGGDALFATCAPGAGGDTLCATYDDGVTTGTCIAAASTTAEQRARAGLFMVCESDSGSINFTVRKGFLTK